MEKLIQAPASSPGACFTQWRG